MQPDSPPARLSCAGSDRLSISDPRALFLLAAAALPGLVSCGQEASAATPKTGGKTAVLLVSHGSHSETWRNTLVDVEDSVRERLLADPRVGAVRTAFMEYTEPSIATRLKEFDRAGFEDVVLVPVLLTVSSHSFDDIPAIYGAKADVATLQNLEAEGIERYTPRARVTPTPLLDFPSVLKTNMARRARQLSKGFDDEGLVLVAYGSTPYNEEWTAMLEDLGAYLQTELGVSKTEFSWCGHIVHYDTEPTTKAIEAVLAEKKRAIVIPLLVAVDESFQIELIGEAIENASDPNRVIYRPDSILPDPDVNAWVVSICTETLDAMDAGPETSE